MRVERNLCKENWLQIFVRIVYFQHLILMAKSQCLFDDISIHIYEITQL